MINFIRCVKANCISKDFHAIAEANLHMYSKLVAIDTPAADVIPFLLCWQQNEMYAKVSEEKEYNVKKKENWRNVAKTDSRKMWKIIEYHEKDTTSTKKHTISSTIINDYFTNIFQAEDLATNPTIEDIQRDVSNYSIHHDIS